MTTALWNAVMGAGGSATSITWYDALEFACKPSQSTGKKYRMMTEAEFEYAAKKHLSSLETEARGEKVPYNDYHSAGIAQSMECAMRPLTIDGRLNYLNADGAIALATSFERGGFFSEGLAPVFRDGKYGYIDEQGKERTPFEYENCRPFRKGYAGVTVGGRWGMIDRHGTRVIAPVYGAIGNYACGLVGVQPRQFGPCRYVSLGGKTVIPTVEGYAVIQDFAEDLLNAQDSKSGLWGYLDTGGAWRLSPKYTHTFPFTEALGQFRIEEKRRDYSGFVDREGHEVIVLEKPTFADMATPGFREGLAIVGHERKSGSKYGFVDKQGAEVIPCAFDSLERFSEGLARAETRGRYGYIDRLGNWVIPPHYDSTLWGSFHQGTAMVGLGDRQLLINARGDVLWPKLTAAERKALRVARSPKTISPLDYLVRTAMPVAKRMLLAHEPLAATLRALVERCATDAPHALWKKIGVFDFRRESAPIVAKLRRAIRKIDPRTKVIWVAADDYPEGFALLGATEWSGKASDWRWLGYTDRDFAKIRSPLCAKALAMARMLDDETPHGKVAPHTVLEMLFPLVYFGACALEALRGLDRKALAGVGLAVGHIEGDDGIIVTQNIAKVAI